MVSDIGSPAPGMDGHAIRLGIGLKEFLQFVLGALTFPL
jgi:hypothetical protein